MIRGTTTLIAHLGYPTEAFKAPMIYNPYFEKYGIDAIDAIVMPMGVKADDYAEVFQSVFRLTNIRGALIAMPHKISTIPLLDEVSTTVKIAGSCNAVLRRPDGTLLGDMFDGTGFVRGVRRKGRKLDGARMPVVGSGGVGSAIAASLGPPGSARSGCLTPIPPRPKRWAAGFASIIRSYRWPSAAMIRPAMTSSSTRPQSACPMATHCPWTSLALIRPLSSARW